MAKLNTLFESFLSNIEPSEDAVKYAQDAHKPVRDYLKDDKEFKQYFVKSFLYGSYKRHTAVGDIKDVDIVVLTNFDIASEENTPAKVLRKLKAALARYYNDPENPEYQRRSIRINDPLPDNPEVEMTLDIIPAVATDGEDQPLWVPDRELKEWIKSHPKGHLGHTTECNSEDYSKQRFVPVVKIMKWWWKYQSELRQPDVARPKPKGFWIECLTGEHFDTSKYEWADHFIAILEGISDEYVAANEVPNLDDPGLEGETVKTNMTLDEFQLFMDTVNDYLELAKTARDEPDKLRSSELWREIFGEKFPLYDEEETKESRTASKNVLLGVHSHTSPMPWPERYQRKIKVHIDAYIGEGGLNSNGRVLSSGLKIRYEARTNLTGDYEVFWQVVNTGRHAEQENGLRGGYFKARLSNGSASSNPLVTWESTRYTGKHWIECFVVKDNRCVARSGKFFITVRNPNFR